MCWKKHNLVDVIVTCSFFPTLNRQREWIEKINENQSNRYILKEERKEKDMCLIISNFLSNLIKIVNNLKNLTRIYTHFILLQTISLRFRSITYIFYSLFLLLLFCCNKKWRYMSKVDVPSNLMFTSMKFFFCFGWWNIIYHFDMNL